jgi:hypothetical protein
MYKICHVLEYSWENYTILKKVLLTLPGTKGKSVSEVPIIYKKSFPRTVYTVASNKSILLPAQLLFY